MNDETYTWGIPDPEAPLRRALRWSDPELFILDGREWHEGSARRHGSKAEFFGIDVELGRNRNLAVRFFLLADEDDQRRYPTPRGYIVAISRDLAYVLDHRGRVLKKFSEWEHLRERA